MLNIALVKKVFEFHFSLRLGKKIGEGIHFLNTDFEEELIFAILILQNEAMETRG